MTAAERFVKRMLGSISSSSYLNPNGAKGDKKWRDSALDVAIAYLNDPANDNVKPNVFSKRWAVKKNTEEGKSKGKNTAKTAQNSLYDALVADESPKDQTLEQHDKQHHPKGFNPETDTCKFRERITTETETDKGDILDSENGIENHKEKQFEIIKSTNPMTDDYHVGIRSIDDIKTFAEVCEEDPPANPDVTDDIISEAKKSGLITVYSSKPITNGTFVTPSQMMARDYAGGGEIFSKEVKLEDVAWISGDEGQYSQVGDSAKPTTLPKADKPQAKVYEGQKKLLVSPEEDKAYMEAVERGDMETAARMVREVAGRAFPNTKVVDADGLPKIVYHGGNFRKYETVPDLEPGEMHFGTIEAAKERVAYKYQGMEDSVSIDGYFLNLENPKRMGDIGGDSIWLDWSDEEDRKHDGVVYNNESEDKGEDSYGVSWEPSRIKSADPVTYDDDGNVIPLSRRFDDGDDIRGDVSGSSPSESNGEEFGESFYASVYPDRDESFSAEFAPAMEEESRKADESYAANFSKDGTYKLPFANGRFGKGIMDKVREEQKKQAEEAKRQEEEQKRQAETEQTISENITKGMESISAEDAQEYISGLFTTLKDCGEVQRKAENRLARYPKKRKQETLRFVAATLKDILPRYPKVADALAHCAFYPCRPRSSDSYAAVTRALYKDSGRVELKGQFMAFPYTHREQDELSFDSDGGKHMAWCIDNYPTNDVMANRACFMHEVGHLLMNGERYEDKENNEAAWGKIVNEGRQEMEKWDSNISLYPQTCDTGRTRLIELHSECVALFTMPGYGQDSNLPKLPKCVEEYLRKELIG